MSKSATTGRQSLPLAFEASVLNLERKLSPWEIRERILAPCDCDETRRQGKPRVFTVYETRAYLGELTGEYPGTTDPLELRRMVEANTMMEEKASVTTGGALKFSKRERAYMLVAIEDFWPEDA